MAAEHIPESDWEDVLFERLSYLCDFHGRTCQHGECNECRRLKSVRALLLEPFTEKTNSVSI